MNIMGGPTPLLTLVWGETGIGKSRLLHSAVARQPGSRYTTFLDLSEELIQSLTQPKSGRSLWDTPALLAIDEPWPLWPPEQRPATWTELARLLIVHRVMQARPTVMVVDPTSSFIRPALREATREGRRLGTMGVLRIAMGPPTRRRRIRWATRKASKLGLRPASQAVLSCVDLEPWNFGVAHGLLLRLAFARGGSWLADQ